jgi:acyl-CoA oxidase
VFTLCLSPVAEVILHDEELKSQPALLDIMRLNFELYATYTMMEAGDEFLASGYISPNQYELLRNQVDRLLATMRPQAVALVDGFALPDYVLNSALGSYDGDVYNRLFDFAVREPLNGITFNTDYKSVFLPLLPLPLPPPPKFHFPVRKLD